jgi:hypothetical protein
LNGPESGPSAQDLERLAARMAPLVGLPLAELVPTSLPQGTAPANPAPVSPAASALWKGGLGKLASSAALKTVASLCAVGAGLWWASQSARPTQSVSAPTVVQAPAAPAPELRAPEPVAPVATREQTLESPALQATEPRPTAAKLRKREPKTSAAAVAIPDELTLIKQAQGMRGQGAAMLSVLAEHARLYPSGMLAQEREVLAIEALVAMGRTREANARAERLASQYPGSAHLTRVRALLQKSGQQ